MPKPRARDLGITIGDLPPGPLNAITDVPGVLVGHVTIIEDTPQIRRTGVTAVLARADIHQRYAPAGYHSLNGMGELTGAHWIAESGLLGVPVLITGSLSLGAVYDAVCDYALVRGAADGFMPVVAETWDGYLSSLEAGVVTRAHVTQALEAAQGGPVAEGAVGGGTGMICHGWKGGIGTSSRLVEIDGQNYTLGALVQANYGSPKDLRIDGVPVGRQLPNPWEQRRSPTESGGSIIIIVATDAPLVGDQCGRIAQRAGMGLARVGSFAHNSSGDIFLAFSTGNALPADASGPLTVQTLLPGALDPLFHAAVESVEEAVLNALCAAESMTGVEGRYVPALPLESVRQLLRAAGR